MSANSYLTSSLISKFLTMIWHGRNICKVLILSLWISRGLDTVQKDYRSFSQAQSFLINCSQVLSPVLRCPDKHSISLISKASTVTRIFISLASVNLLTELYRVINGLLWLWSNETIESIWSISRSCKSEHQLSLRPTGKEIKIHE